MNIAIACDHAALDQKLELIEQIRELGHQVKDCGTDSAESCDYPDYAQAAAKLVQSGDADRAILLCGTGIGMSMAANKMEGIRAALISDTFSARMTRLHNAANVACFGVRVLGPELIRECTEVFLTTEYEGGRHQQRVGKIMALQGQ